MFPVPARGGSDRLQIGARVRFGHRNRADQLAASQPRQPTLLLRGRPVPIHILRANAVHARCEANQATASQSVVHDGLVAEVAAATAILLRNVRTQQAYVAGLAPDLVPDAALAAPTRILRHHPLVDEALGDFAKQRQLFVHPWRAADLVSHSSTLLRTGS